MQMKSRLIGGLFLSSMIFGFLTGLLRHVSGCKVVEDEANNFFPVQSDSERAAGHPIVGVS